ncbi:hypothetical protein SPBR_00443 [Sporothrix brasiliensis 5110]|uniref:Uncharacterized protein n=1 Tax=Sporothrix brasiliensis 5110 TaxID=1398154 RepID=A0A0C2EVK2_9PEZI|nr:uncharacterized protein SPBR_00443 [Sporothrix brasiliensis 5110]KIH90594.1 hypothetical protein SPBR_00443 [Sporothrix brasiliensis 5110]
MAASKPATAASRADSSKERMLSQRRHHRQLNQAANEVSHQLAHLANLERPGLWILHHEDLYRPGIDTRPHSRDPDREIPLSLPGLKQGTIWDGKGPAPDFNDVAFWEAKRSELGEKIKEVEAGRVQPRFMPEELKTIESLEQQAGHVFHAVLETKRCAIRNSKFGVFNTLFLLAKLGRPGQWILHNEDLYHPAIDTRPDTRAHQTSIVIRDATYDGSTLFLGDGELLINFELTWPGSLPTPDFADLPFWETKFKELTGKLIEAEEGLVQPRFTPEELHTLELLEADTSHAFAVFAREAKANPPVKDTPESRARAKSLFLLQSRCVNQLESLWDHGLAGKWVVHGEDLYVPKYDTHFRERDADGEDGAGTGYVLIDSDLDLRLDTRFKPAPLDDLETVAYWEQKLAALGNTYEDVRAGRLTAHHFSKGERMRIALLDRAIDEELEALSRGATNNTGRRTDTVAAWLGGGTNTAAATPWPDEPGRQRTQTPSPLRSLSDGPAAAVGPQRQAAETKRKPEARKRKRAADEEHEPPNRGRGQRATKRSKQRGAATPRPTTGRRARPTDTAPLRRSARIAAQPPKSYR